MKNAICSAADVRCPYRNGPSRDMHVAGAVAVLSDTMASARLSLLEKSPSVYRPCSRGILKRCPHVSGLPKRVAGVVAQAEEVAAMGRAKEELFGTPEGSGSDSGTRL